MRSLKYYKIALWVVLILLLLPLMVAAFYNRMGTDDITSLLFAEEVSQSSHPAFLYALQRAVEVSYDLWLTLTGTFGWVIYNRMLWYIFREALPVVYPIAILLMLVVSAFQAASCLRCVCKDISKDAASCLALLLSIMSVLFFPDTHQGLYWVTGAGYCMVYALTLCAFCSLFKRCYKEDPNHPSRARDWIFIVLFSLFLFIVVGGGDHLNATFFIVLYGFLTLWILWAKKPKKYLIPYLFLIAGYLLVVLAPGNFVRQEMVGTTRPSLGNALFFSFYKSIQLIFEDNRCWIFLLLCLPPAISIAPKWRVTGRQLACCLFASLVLLAASFFPFQFSAYNVFPRHTARLFLSLCLLMILNLVLFISALPPSIKAFALPSKKQWVALLCTAAISIGVLSHPWLQLSPLRLNTTIPSIRAVANLLDGQLAQYAKDYDDLAATVRAHPTKLIYRKLPTNDLLGNPGLTNDPTYFQNVEFAEYYGGKGSRVLCYYVE